MKKILALVLSFAMIFALAGCGGGTGSESTSGTDETKETGGSTSAITMEDLDINPLIPDGEKILDYSKGLDGLPPSNVLKFCFPGGSWIAVRPSGTEPKIKFYYCIRAAEQREAKKSYKSVQKSIEEFLETV